MAVCDASGEIRVDVALDEVLDAAPVGDELWVAASRRLIRLSARDGARIADDPIDDLDPEGRFLQSSTAPQLPVWHADRPVDRKSVV